jgi:hypothetical protein
MSTATPPPSRIVYGQEPYWRRKNVTPPALCDDCRVALGEIHALLCCVETCAYCGEGQALSCSCAHARARRLGIPMPEQASITVRV